jgi:hypothetical protein
LSDLPLEPAARPPSAKKPKKKFGGIRLPDFLYFADRRRKDPAAFGKEDCRAGAEIGRVSDLIIGLRRVTLWILIS